LWIPDSKVWRGPRRWQPLTRFAEPRDQEFRKFETTTRALVIHDNHVQATLKESGSATAILIDPSDEGIRQAEIRVPGFVRLAENPLATRPHEKKASFR
jgi:hypothetical protein